MRAIKTAILVAMSYGLPAVAAADVGAQVTLGTDYVFRGVSQTMSDPTVQAAASTLGAAPPRTRPGARRSER